MEIKNFVQHFAELFDDTDINTFDEKTKYKELEEWSSLLALSVIAMVDEEYNVKIKGDDIRGAETIGSLFNIIKSK